MKVGRGELFTGPTSYNMINEIWFLLRYLYLKFDVVLNRIASEKCLR